jgi:hypothetical protein
MELRVFLLEQFLLAFHTFQLLQLKIVALKLTMSLGGVHRTLDDEDGTLCSLYPPLGMQEEASMCPMVPVQNWQPRKVYQYIDDEMPVVERVHASPNGVDATEVHWCAHEVRDATSGSWRAMADADEASFGG